MMNVIVFTYMGWGDDERRVGGLGVGGLGIEGVRKGTLYKYNQSRQVGR